ncbi:hypothetical protein KBD34_03530 [Patescibacteria group bacterium]|nr:hypothetical protein [Patescibacteria group bacterium]
MQLLRMILIALAVALMAACGIEGSNVVGPREDSSTSVTDDRRDPADGSQPDSTPTPDAAIAKDVPPSTDTPTDNPVVIDAGTDAAEDASVADDASICNPDPAFMCQAMLAQAQTVTFIENTEQQLMTFTVRPICGERGTRATLTELGFPGVWTECHSNECASQPMSDGSRMILRYTMTGSTCSSCADMLQMQGGMPMNRTTGVLRICTR